jgi:hypothetical protein
MVLSGYERLRAMLSRLRHLRASLPEPVRAGRLANGYGAATALRGDANRVEPCRHLGEVVRQPSLLDPVSVLADPESILASARGPTHTP